MMEGFEFSHPWFLVMLPLIPLLALWKGRRGAAMALRMPSTENAVEVGAVPRSRAGGFLFFFGLLSLAMLVIALARPRLGEGSSEVEASGIDILLALDVSSSMEALDFEMNGMRANRLDVVKKAVAKFIGERPNDRIGMIAFAGRPYLVSPLTHDQEFLGQRLETLKMGRVEDGTAIGSAIASSADHLKDSDAKSRIIVLLTDGVNNAGAVNPLTAAEAAKALGIKIYTIGAGTQGLAPYPVRDRFGRMRIQQIEVEIDEKMLGKVAETTGGQYFRATDAGSLDRIYDSINSLEKTTRKLKEYQEYRELYMWFLWPAIGILMIDVLLKQTRFRTLP